MLSAYLWYIKWWWWLCWWSWWWWWICWFSRLLMRLKFFVYTDIDYDHGTNEYHFHSISFGRSCSAWFYIWGLVFFQDEILSKISCYIVVKPYEILQDQFDYKVQSLSYNHGGAGGGWGGLGQNPNLKPYFFFIKRLPLIWLILKKKIPWCWPGTDIRKSNMRILSVTLKSQYHQGLILFTPKYLFLHRTLSSKNAHMCVNAIIYMESDFNTKKNRIRLTCIRF